MREGIQSKKDQKRIRFEYHAKDKINNNVLGARKILRKCYFGRINRLVHFYVRLQVRVLISEADVCFVVGGIVVVTLRALRAAIWTDVVVTPFGHCRIRK